MSNIETSFATDAMESEVWVVLGATIETRINEPYLVRVDIRTDRDDADPLDLLGSGAELQLRNGDETNAYAGVISSIRRTQSGAAAGIGASVTLEPALVSLKHGRDTRIFQDLSVAEILESVLSEALSPYGRSVRLELQRSYPKREYTVQYQESNFAFAHRMMEEQGILYVFDQDGGVETMVLLDDPSAHTAIAGETLLEYSETEGPTGMHQRGYVRVFDPLSSVQGTEVATCHFDWTRPGVRVRAASEPGEAGETPNGAASGPVRESYQHDRPLTLHGYAGSYQAYDEADQVRVRRDAQARHALVFEGWGSVSDSRVGSRFDLNNHPNVALNSSYVFIGVTHYVNAHAVDTPGADRGYFNRFVCINSDVPYRPERVHPRPAIQGIQTAVVTGPAGEEIHTDEHGRVKVQFHWDRVGGYDDRTTCWIRVMQSWSGSGFGAFVLPRVGMEVIVSFINGDPDRPLVTGCVYNGGNGNPYEMPAKKMLSVFKTRSYPGGGGFNELRFDDSKGEEEIWVQGEKDWNTLIKHDLTRDVLNDETRFVGVDQDLTVGHDRSRKVLHDETVKVSNDRTKTVVMNETLNVGINRTRTVGVMENVTVGVNQSMRVGANRSVDVVLNQTTQIGGNQVLKVGCDATRKVDCNENLTVGINRTRKVVNDESITIGNNETTNVVNNRSRTVGNNETLNVATNRTRIVGNDETINIGNSRTKTVGMSETLNVVLSRSRTVGVTESVTVGGMQSITVGAQRNISVLLNQSTKVGGDDTHKVTGDMTFKVDGDKFEIVCGGSMLKLEKGGKVTITGSEFAFEASGACNIVGGPINLN